MFEIIMTAPTFDALRAVHEASLRLSQRERLEYIRETAAFPVTKDELAAWLLSEIEQAEGRELADLTKSETDRYITRMSDMISSRISEEFPLDPKRGKEVLAEMRAAYDERYAARR